MGVTIYLCSQEFFAHLASRMGRFKKGGVPDQEAASRILLNDWNTGKVIQKSLNTYNLPKLQ